MIFALLMCGISATITIIAMVTKDTHLMAGAGIAAIFWLIIVVYLDLKWEARPDE